MAHPPTDLYAAIEPRHTVIYNHLVRVDIDADWHAMDIYDLLPDGASVYFETFQRTNDGRWLQISRRTHRNNIWIHYYGSELHDYTDSINAMKSYSMEQAAAMLTPIEDDYE